MSREGLWLTVFALLLAAGCQAASQSRPSVTSGPLPVVVSIPPLADFVRQVGGSDVAVTVLVTASSPHTYEPLPQQVRELSRARLVLFNGRNLEPWAPRLVREAPSSAKILYITELPRFNQAPYPENAHLWMDIQWARVYVQVIRDALLDQVSNPAVKERIQKRTQTYLQRLDALHQDLKSRFDALPPESRKVAVLHSVWEPFLKPYGFTLVSLFPQGYHTHGASEPSPGDLMQWIQTMQAQGIQVVVLEVQHPEAALERMANDVGLKVVYLDPLGGKPPRATYEDMMRENARVLLEALLSESGASEVQP